MSRHWDFPLTVARTTTTGSGLARMLLATANLVVVMRLLKRERRTASALAVPEALWYVSAALVFCMLVHACDIMAVEQPGRAVSAAASVLAAVLFPTALSWAGRSTAPLTVSAEPRRTTGDRYEQIKTRVVMLEDMLNRNFWIQESRQSVRQLTELLSTCDASSVNPPTTDVGNDPIGRTT